MASGIMMLRFVVTYVIVMLFAVIIALLFAFFAGAAFLPALALGIGFLALSFTVSYAFARHKMSGYFALAFALTFLAILLML